jgi:hypothetical protein
VVNEVFERPFKFYQMEPQRLYLNLSLHPAGDGDLLAHAVLKSRRVLPALKEETVQEKVHFQADVLLTREPVEAPQTSIASPNGDWSEVTANSIYNLYFHGPAYQVLENVLIRGDQALGWMSLSRRRTRSRPTFR